MKNYEKHLVPFVILSSLLLAFYQRQAWCGFVVLFLTIFYEQFNIIIIRYSDFKKSTNDERLKKIEQELISLNALISFKNIRK